MSATPIPRTLEMGVAGIREMSTILTPPEERHPVLTFVGVYDAKQVAAAIRRELLRDGQVFFVHNRVSSIRRVAAQAAELVPEARIAVAHGQMNEHELEQIMVDFWERKYDVLVATTIVESGLDIPNANTLVIDRADLYGLSQLHQLRGRVGRGTAPGLCLLVTEAPPESPSRERLDAVAATLDGFQLSRLDLEQRREGDVLGAAQAGRRSSLRLLQLLKDEDLIGQARGEATEVVSADPDLARHPALREAITELLGVQAEYLDKT